MGTLDFFNKLTSKLKPVLAQIGASPIVHSARRGIAPFEFVGKKIAIVVNSLLLTIAYFTAIAATAIIAKIFRKKFLELKPDMNKKSYWLERNNDDFSKEESYKSF